MYEYETEREKIFTEDGQLMFLRIRDNAKELIKKSGAARLQEIISNNSGDTWVMIACVDRLVEIGELREIHQDKCPGQYRIFVSR